MVEEIGAIPEATVRSYVGHLTLFLDRFAASAPDTSPPALIPNPHVRPCFELRECHDTECPARDNGGLRCWHEPAAGCVRSGLIDASERLAFCHGCDVYRSATPDTESSLAEAINDVAYLLRVQRQQIERSERFLVLGELAARLAHEMRSPLNSLSIAAQRIERKLRKGAPPTVEELLRIQRGVGDDIRRIDGVIDAFVRSVKGRSKRTSAVEIRTVVLEVFDQLSAQLRTRSVTVDFGEDAARVVLPGPLSESIAVILLNLVLNAVEATAENGAVSLRVWLDEEHLQLRVVDDGRGLPPEARGRIFEPFFSTKEFGTGMGLSIAAQLAHRFGGRITVASEPGEGSRFTVRMPRPA